MKTYEVIQKQNQKVARLERNLALVKIKARKRETRRKIELGGLVVKARMDKYPKSIILGALIDAHQNLARDNGFKLLFQSKGEVAFLGHGDN